MKLLLFLFLLLLAEVSYAQNAWDLQGEGKYEEAVAKAREDYAELHWRWTLPSTHQEHLRDTSYAAGISTVGKILFLNDLYDDALPIIHEMSTIWSRYYNDNNKVKYLISLRDLAQVYFYSGLFAESEKTLDKMVQIGLIYPDKTLDVAYVSYLPHNEVASIYQSISRIDKAERELQKAVNFYYQFLIRSDKKINNLANSLANVVDYTMMERYYYAVVDMATFYQNTGHFHKNELLLKQFERLAIMKFGENSASHAIWMSQMISFYAFMGRFDYAEKITNRAEQIFLENKKDENSDEIEPVIPE